MDNNFNILKQKADEFVQAFLLYLENKENQVNNNQNEEKIKQLLENTAEIIKQNNEIIRINKEITNKLSAKDILLETKVDKEEKKQEKNQENTEFERNKEEDSQTNVFNNEQEQEKYQIKQEEQKTKEEPVDNKQEKNTSSVLEFLHNRVINDTSKNAQELEKSMKKDSQTLLKESKAFEKEIPKESMECDLFATEKPKSIFEQFENKTKSDLRTAIGVSEKFLFINDLFSGNIRDCNNFINELNSCDTLQDSMQVIDKKQQENKWAKSSLAYTTLESFIIKRFE